MDLKALALISVASFAALPHQPQAAAQTFRSGVNLVEVDAAVVDADGRPIQGLSQGNFSLYEDGKKMDIAAFEAVDLTRADDGRLITIFIDDVGLPMNSPKTVDTARGIARAIVDGLSPNDSAWIVTASGQGGLAADYTSDKSALLSKIDGVRPALGDEHGTLRMIGDLAEHLGDVPHKRKAIVFISKGAAFNYQILFGGDPDRARQAGYLLDATHNAARANVAIYTFDPFGMQEAINEAQQGMLMLADNTGGVATVNTNDYRAGIARVLDDTRHYYLLGYASAAKPDGKAHQIKVNVDRPSADVFARQTFALPKIQ